MMRFAQSLIRFTLCCLAAQCWAIVTKFLNFRLQRLTIHHSKYPKFLAMVFLLKNLILLKEMDNSFYDDYLVVFYAFHQNLVREVCSSNCYIIETNDNDSSCSLLVRQVFAFSCWYLLAFTVYTTRETFSFLLFTNYSWRDIILL